MYIKQLKIDAFGTLRDRVIELTPGLNIIEGANESGKSAAAMFIKFMLYGLSGKSAGGELTERRRYVNWDTGTASGSMTLTVGDQEYRIERTLAVSRTEDGGKIRETARESVRIIDTATNTQVHRGEVPGEALCGVPENIFMNTVFVRQIDGTRVNASGMLTSIENLLFTADETVGTKKAMDRLEEVRRQILHKNGTGGLLGELRDKRAEAAAALREARSQSGALVGSEEDLGKARRQCDALTEKIRKQEAICRYGAVNLTKRRFDSAADLAEKLSGMHKQLEEAEATGVDRAYAARLADTERRLRMAEETTAKIASARDGAAARLKAASAAAETVEEETEDAVSRASSLQMRTRVLTAAAITFFFLAVAAGLMAWLFHAFSVDMYAIPIIGAGLLCTAGVLCLILRGITAKRLRDSLAEWGAVNITAIPAAISAKHGQRENPDMIRAEKQALDTSFSEAQKLRLAEAETAYELAARVDPTASEKRAAAEDDAECIEGAFALLSSASEAALKFCDETDALRREADNTSGRLAALREQLAGEDEAAVRAAFEQNMQTVEGRIASGIDAPRLETARRQLEEMKASLAAARQQMHEQETGLAAARAVTVSPAEIEEKIRVLDEQIEDLTRRHEACCLAIDTLKNASDAMRSSVLPKVVSEACASVNRLSGDAFEAVGVAQDLSMTFTRGGQTREVDYLSEGTKDVAYVSLRRALTGVLFGSAHPPLIYDESFSRVDETRLTRILTLLSSPEEADTQSILLTCRKLEADIAAASGGAHLVLL